MASTTAPEPQAARPISKVRMAIRFLAFLILWPILMLAVAGDVAWVGGWVTVGLTLISTILSRVILFLVNPDLIRERGESFDRQNVAPFDKILAPLLAIFLPLGVWLVAGLDHRFGWSPAFAPWLFWLGIALFILSYSGATWSLAVNRYFSGVVRIQSDRGHQVISSGPYAVVRHPGYATGMFTYVAMVLVLGSIWTLIPTMALFIVLIVRTSLEDRYLQENLPGYADYAQRVRYRLIPGLW